MRFLIYMIIIMGAYTEFPVILPLQNKISFYFSFTVEAQ